MRGGALFAGYGGLELALRMVLPDLELAWYSEIDKGAVKILEHRFPGVANIGDITKVDWARVTPVEVLGGGFPCQDVSSAGYRRGLRAGTRSGLWYEFAEAIRQLKPKLVVIENVRGLLSADAHSELGCDGCVASIPEKGEVLRALGAVLGDLADLGYDASWHGLRAADVGAPHGRFRVFVVAYPAGTGASLAADLGLERDGPARGGWSGPEDGGQGSAADAATSGRDQREPKPARLERGPDVGGGDRESEDGLTLLPTPVASEGRKANYQSTDSREGHHNYLSNAVYDVVEHPLLGTPTARDGKGVGAPGSETQQWALEHSNVEGQILDLFPTPTTGDGKHSSDGTPHHAAIPDLLPTPTTGRGGESSDGASMLPGAVRDLLPTPTATDMGGNKTPEEWDDWTDKMRERHNNGAGHGNSLNVEAQKLLPTPNTMDSLPERSDEALARARQVGGCSNLKDVRSHEWGKYGPAVLRWEGLTRPAPEPTMTSTVGTPQLAPRFSEWMMGLPAGWVTDVPDLARGAQLHALGNGVCPQQAAAGIRAAITIAGMSVASSWADAKQQKSWSKVLRKELKKK